MKKFRTLIVVFIVVICFYLFGMITGLFGAGSYPYAQKYQFSTNRIKLLENIETLKAQDSNLEVPKNIEIVDQNDSFGNFHVYIYFSSENEMIHFFVGGEENYDNKSNLYLVGARKINSLGRWQIINEDFPRSENIAIKNEFVRRILDKLNLPYRDKGNGMWVFWK